jgi:hypothetical protein
LNVVFDGVNDTVDYQLEKLLLTNKLSKRRYYRFQVTLDVGNDDMDDASKTNIRILKIKAEELITEKTKDLDSLCKLLTT